MKNHYFALTNLGHQKLIVQSVLHRIEFSFLIEDYFNDNNLIKEDFLTTNHCGFNCIIPKVLKELHKISKKKIDYTGNKYWIIKKVSNFKFIDNEH